MRLYRDIAGTNTRSAFASRALFWLMQHYFVDRGHVFLRLCSATDLSS
jgi:hypothetical protein